MSETDHGHSSPDAGGSPDETPPGRPHVLDDFKKEQICALVAAGCNRAQAARCVGCAPNTIKRTALRDPDFAARLEQAKVRREVTELDKIRRAGGRSWRASAWLLRHYNPRRFSSTPGNRYTHEQLLRVARYVAQEIAAACPSEIRLFGEEDRLEKVLKELSTSAGVRRCLKSKCAEQV